jgi:hypothetical protein
MKIKNTSTGTITISDLPGGQSGSGLTLQSQAEVLLFDEDAERSAQLSTLMTAGLIVKLSGEEPLDTGPAADQLGGLQSQNLVVVSGVPTVGQVMTATGAAAANWQTPSGGGTPPLIVQVVSQVSVSIPLAAGKIYRVDYFLTQEVGNDELVMTINGDASPIYNSGWSGVSFSFGNDGVNSYTANANIRAERIQSSPGTPHFGNLTLRAGVGGNGAFLFGLLATLDTIVTGGGVWPGLVPPASLELLTLGGNPVSGQVMLTQLN